MPAFQRWKVLVKAISLREGGAGGDTEEGKKGAKTVGNLLISTNYLSRKCWKLERICVSKSKIKDC